MLCVQRMLRIFEKLILKLPALFIGLDRLDCLGNLTRPLLLIKLAQLFTRCSTLARIVIGEPRVPPDARVNRIRQLLTVLVRTRLLPARSWRTRSGRAISILEVSTSLPCMSIGVFNAGRPGTFSLGNPKTYTT